MEETLAPAPCGGGGGPAAAAEAAEAAEEESEWMGRVEIDTSAPFESVKEAVDRFGGSAVWRSQLKQLFAPEKIHGSEDVDVMEVEEQAAQLEKDLIVRERETLEVLKELEETKNIIASLKLKIQSETSEANINPSLNADSRKVHPIVDTEENVSGNIEKCVDIGGPIGPNQPPGLILMELKQAKMNLNRTTGDLAGVRASIDLLNTKIEKEKLLLEKTREKLSSSTSIISSLEEEINQTTLKIQEKDSSECKSCEDPSDIASQIEQLNGEVEKSRNMIDAAKSEVMRLTAEIEQTKVSIRTAEIRGLAAKKMEEAAKAAEAIALAEIKALINSENSMIDPESNCSVTLSVEEYLMLTCKAQEADERSRKRIADAMIEVDEANCYKSELLVKVEEAKVESTASKRALEEALLRVEAANRGKLAIEEALRIWRSEHGQKKRSVQSTAKFKNSTHHRRDSRVIDLNGFNLVTDGTRNSLRPTMTIGQILSMKLMGPEEYDTSILEKKIEEEPKANSLGQMLNRKHGTLSTKDGSSARKQMPAKRKKFGFAGFSALLAKQHKNKKKRQT